MNKEFRLPDVGEGLTEADIVSWHVKTGDTVTINQVIVEIETAKAVVELPSPYAGTVSALLVAEGQTVDVGVPIIAIDVPVAGEAPPADATRAADETPAADDDAQAAAGAAPQQTDVPAPPARQPVLVGYGVKPGSTSRRPRKRPPTRPGSYPASPSYPAAPPPPPGGLGGQAPPNRGVCGGPGGMGGGSPPCWKVAPGEKHRQAAGATACPGPRHRSRRPDGERARGVRHQTGRAEGGRRSSGPFDTSVF